MYKVNEIFQSLQGEGYNTGTASVFIRLSGCNLRCSFCDTRHEEGTMMSLPEIVEEVMQYPLAPLIVLTGGEPSLWIDEDFVSGLKHMTGMKVVYLGQDLTQYDGITATHRYLQPCWVSDENQRFNNMRATVQAVLNNPQWRLSLQTHRILGIQ